MNTVGNGSGREVTSLQIGPTVLNKLVQHGFRTLADFVGVSNRELVQECEIDAKEAAQVLREVKRAKDPNLFHEPTQRPQTQNTCSPLPYQLKNGISAVELLEHDEKKWPVLTFCKAIDEMLGGGVQIGEVTEFCGEPGVGKTQIGIQLAVDASIPSWASRAGPAGKAIYIDTEGSFMPERAAQVAAALCAHLQNLRQRRVRRLAARQGLSPAAAAARLPAAPTPEGILANILVLRVHDHVEQVAVVRHLPALLARLAAEEQEERQARAEAAAVGSAAAAAGDGAPGAAAPPPAVQGVGGGGGAEGGGAAGGGGADGKAAAAAAEGGEADGGAGAARLVVLDSVAFHFRHGFSAAAASAGGGGGSGGGGGGANRTRLLADMGQRLMKLAQDHGVAVVAINQVTTKLDFSPENGGTSSKLVPALGETWAHAATSRIMLSWENGRRKASLFKSPRFPPQSGFYEVKASGIRDPDSGRPGPTDGHRRLPPVISPPQQPLLAGPHPAAAAALTAAQHKKKRDFATALAAAAGEGGGAAAEHAAEGGGRGGGGDRRGGRDDDREEGQRRR